MKNISLVNLGEARKTSRLDSTKCFSSLDETSNFILSIKYALLFYTQLG